jgi:ribose 5-phosphate isomerase B
VKLAIGSDHAGWRLKEHLRTALTQQGHQVLDLGTDSEASCDYPQFAAAVARAVAAGEAERGVLACGTGIGMAMAANRVPGIRAANCNDLFSVRLARAHNDANVIAVGSRVVAPAHAEALVGEILATPFEGGRHQRRVEQIAALDCKP